MNKKQIIVSVIGMFMLISAAFIRQYNFGGAGQQAQGNAEDPKEKLLNAISIYKITVGVPQKRSNSVFFRKNWHLSF